MKTKRRVRRQSVRKRNGVSTWELGGLWWDVEPWCSWRTGRPPSAHPGSLWLGSRAGPRPSGPALAAVASELPRDSQAPPLSPSTASVESHRAPGKTDGNAQLFYKSSFKFILFWFILCLHLIAERGEMTGNEERGKLEITLFVICLGLDVNQRPGTLMVSTITPWKDAPLHM